MKTRILAIGSAICLLIICGAYEATSAIHQEAAEDVLVTDDLSEYTNREVLVGYTDGTFEVFSYENDDTLAAGLKTLSVEPNVTLVQPNYTYTSDGLTTTEPLAKQQWALFNDGTFQIGTGTQKSQFPVYDPSLEVTEIENQWMAFGELDGSGEVSDGSEGSDIDSSGTTSTTQQVNAVAGIDINAETAFSLYDGGKRDVIVAIIDTGIDISHDELKDSIWVNEDEIPGNGIDDDGNGYIDDVNGWSFYNNSNQIYANRSEDIHGTHGAGTIVASADNNTGIRGIVPSEHVKIMVLKTLGGANGSGTTDMIVKAIQYAEANGASICNLSLGTTTNDRALYQAISNSSMLFVVAAGNNSVNTDTTPCYPASYTLDNIISVANLNYDGTLHSSSSYGPTSVDLAAPGAYILSTTPENSYAYMTGTSMAAPMVSAAAAMLYSYDESLTLTEVKNILLSTVHHLDSLSKKTLTGGMLDLGAAMTYDHEQQVKAAKSSNGKGSAPKIEITTDDQQNVTYLTVKVTDADGDLDSTLYAEGKISVAQFKSGTVGRAFTVEKDGTMTFSVTSSGTYSFYAKDSAGNETVKMATVSRESAKATIEIQQWMTYVPTVPLFQIE
jgi:subtilisin family serine protease